MKKQLWCEHLDKSSKFTDIKYEYSHTTVTVRIQSWFCPECGVHGAESELVPQDKEQKDVAG